MAMGTSLLVLVQWHGYRAIAIDALLILLEAQFAIGAFLVVARNWDISVRALGCLCIMRLNRLTTECRRSRPEVATAAGCGTSPIQHGMWHHTTAAHSTMQACRAR